MSPETAANAWPAVEEVALKAGNLSIASPALNYCYQNCWESDPVQYLRYFFGNCSGCKVDYVAIHCYMCLLDELKYYLARFEEFGLPIVLSEFSCDQYLKSR